MAESDDGSAEVPPPSERPAGMPRWVKISLIVALVLIVVFFFVNLAGGGGGHGPRRHSGVGEIWAVEAIA